MLKSNQFMVNVDTPNLSNQSYKEYGLLLGKKKDTVNMSGLKNDISRERLF